jgi:hypothetical protein
MKTQIFKSLDPDLIDLDDDASFGDRIRLTPDQSVELAVYSCLQIEGKTWFKKRRFDYVGQIKGNLKPGEIIAENFGGAYILSPFQDDSLPAKKAFMFQK